mgnify:CR=1 FL=1
MPTPAVPGIQGLRGTGQFSVDFRPTNYRELFTLLEPNGDAPLQALLAMAASESTDDPHFNNFRDHLPARAMVVETAVADATTATVVLKASDENAFIIPGSILVNATTGEFMHVSAVNLGTRTLTVVRNVGGTTHNIAANAELFVSGYAAKEGADTPEPISFDARVALNYTQIFRQAFSLTGTLKETYLRTGPKADEMRTKALKLHMSDIERAMFFGKKHIINGNTAEPTRFTGGIINSITGVTDLATATTPGKMVENEFDRLLIDNVFAWGSKEKLCFCGPTIAGHMQQIGKARWQPQQVEGSYGIGFVRYRTFAGDLLVHVHPQFRQIPGMTDSAVIIDFPYVKYRFMQGRDTDLLENRQGNGEDREKHEWLTECGLELLQDMVHHFIKGWKTAV